MRLWVTVRWTNGHDPSSRPFTRAVCVPAQGQTRLAFFRTAPITASRAGRASPPTPSHTLHGGRVKAMQQLRYQCKANRTCVQIRIKFQVLLQDVRTDGAHRPVERERLRLKTHQSYAVTRTLGTTRKQHNATLKKREHCRTEARTSREYSRGGKGTHVDSLMPV